MLSRSYTTTESIIGMLKQISSKEIDVQCSVSYILPHYMLGFKIKEANWFLSPEKTKTICPKLPCTESL